MKSDPFVQDSLPAAPGGVVELSDDFLEEVHGGWPGWGVLVSGAKALGGAIVNGAAAAGNAALSLAGKAGSAVVSGGARVLKKLLTPRFL